MEIAAPPETDRTDPDGKWTAVRVKPVRPLEKPVSLKAMKAEPRLSGMVLLRQSRLSVAPINADEWKVLLKMADS